MPDFRITYTSTAGRPRTFTCRAENESEARELTVKHMGIDFGQITGVERGIGEFPVHMDKVEAQIVNRLLTYTLGHPDVLMVRVYDGEEWATEWTRSRAEIQREVAATDMTRLFIMKVNPNGAAHRMGSILLVHGNVEDVVSDGSWNPKQEGAEALINAIMAAANDAYAD